MMDASPLVDCEDPRGPLEESYNKRHCSVNDEAHHDGDRVVVNRSAEDGVGDNDVELEDAYDRDGGCQSPFQSGDEDPRVARNRDLLAADSPMQVQVSRTYDLDGGRQSPFESEDEDEDDGADNYENWVSYACANYGHLYGIDAGRDVIFMNASDSEGDSDDEYDYDSCEGPYDFGLLGKAQIFRGSKRHAEFAGGFPEDVLKLPKTLTWASKRSQRNRSDDNVCKRRDLVRSASPPKKRHALLEMAGAVDKARRNRSHRTSKSPPMKRLALPLYQFSERVPPYICGN